MDLDVAKDAAMKMMAACSGVPFEVKIHAMSILIAGTIRSTAPTPETGKKLSHDFYEAVDENLDQMYG